MDENTSSQTINHQEQIDELRFLAYCIGAKQDWFMPEEIQILRPEYTIAQITYFLNKASDSGFFEIVNKAFEEGYPKFKKTVKFDSSAIVTPVICSEQVNG